ncbi:YwqJ-related putative deaminase [Nocardia sp. NPDC055321]
MRRTTLSDSRPTVASSILIHNHVYSQTNAVGASSPDLHPAIREFLSGLPKSQQLPPQGLCAEAALISDQLWGLESEASDSPQVTLQESCRHFEGAVIISRRIASNGEGGEGDPAEPCPACRALIDALGIRVLSS